MMGTVVTFQVVGHAANDADRRERDAAIDRATDWFRRVETCCTRFDATSELRMLCERLGEPVVVSKMLFEAVQFALAVAAETNGAFDPTVGGAMESRGFNREHRSGVVTRSAGGSAPQASFRDIQIDPATRAITIARPLTLDLGAVAKGLAIDLAARELMPLEDFAIDAGGDLYLAGRNADGEPWRVGIRHPREAGAMIETLRVSGAAVCTSGDYERVGVSTDGAHHIMDQRSATSPVALASVLASATVIAPTATVADALATAVFVLGPVDGVDLLDRHGADGVLFTPSLERHATRGMLAPVSA